MLKVSISKPLPYAWKHSMLAYDQPLDASENELLNGSIVVPIDSTEDFAYVAIYDKYVIISFQGTVGDITPWLSNMDPYPLKAEEYNGKYLRNGKWGKGMIHDGFYTTWKFFKLEIDRIIKEYGITSKKYKIITCGHSRGGALAELCSRHLAKNKMMPNSCFTFGCPRVGNKEYRDQFRMLPINGTRVVNGWDIVAMVPPKVLGFKHGCANLIWNKKAWWMRFIPHIKISDHLTKNYDKFIESKFMK